MSFHALILLYQKYILILNVLSQRKRRILLLQSTQSCSLLINIWHPTKYPILRNEVMQFLLKTRHSKNDKIDVLPASEGIGKA